MTDIKVVNIEDIDLKDIYGDFKGHYFSENGVKLFEIYLEKHNADYYEQDKQDQYSFRKLSKRVKEAQESGFDMIIIEQYRS